jgi:nicotinic acid mononucleotide adenylyltransferase
MIPTYFLMKEISEKAAYKDKLLFFVLGTDLLAGLHLWDEGEALKNEINFIIFKREGHDANLVEGLLPAKYQLVEGLFTSMSSTKIRNRIMQTRTEQPLNPTLGVLGIVTPSVKAYIEKLNLYCSESIRFN